mmetsp:Transcript_29245/g.73316  ORF Transcript_29245/g.73316 Transcript_29245/m.73316 type:complete len:244 (+) Transcript_29245:710-1441(+)
MAPLMVPPVWATSTRAGDVSHIAAAASTDAGIVAVTSATCGLPPCLAPSASASRSGASTSAAPFLRFVVVLASPLPATFARWRMRSSWSLKPSERSLSASSSTMYMRCSKVVLPSSSMSSSRPGVATSRCGAGGPRRAAWPALSAPPKRVAQRRPKRPRMGSAAAAVCAATSRVGASTRTRGPGGAASSRQPAASRRSSAGRRKPSVLPLPVGASTSASLPCARTGQHCRCTSVGTLKPSASR